MRGPPPTPTVLRLLRGNPSKRGLRREPEPMQTAELPEPPEFLAGYACDEWHRVAPELHRLGLLTVVDVAPLAAYCQSYAHWRTAEEALARTAEKDPLTTSGLMVKRMDGNTAQNPLLRMANDAARDMVRYAGEFGLTPVARTRIAAGIYEQPKGKFDGLLG